MRSGLLFLAALLLALLASPVRAQVLHRTEPGETLSELAQRYYGDASFADLIAAHNKLARDPQPGVELRLPSASRHTVARRESWNDLAARYWSDASLGPALARWCGFDPAAPPAVGSVIEIPALFTYRLKPGETLVGLARRFQRDPSRGVLLAELNRVPDPKYVHAGRELRIPVMASVREAGETASKSASEPPASASKPSRDVASGPPRSDPALTPDLMSAVNAYLDGDFEAALSQLEQQRPKLLAKGSDSERKLLLRYLIFSYVAFERNDAACDAYAALRGIERKPDLDPELVSPKIRDALARCD
jgi:LysM repeat protein